MPLAKKLAVYIIFLIAIIFCFRFVANFYQHATFNDLRNRVVGSRLADNNRNAYFHKYNPVADSTNLLDPYERQIWIVNGNTVTPTTLLLTNALHNLPQYQINGIWLWVSFAAFFIIILFIYRQQNDVLFLLASVLLLSAPWQLHIFKGQMYIFYALLAIGSIFCFVRNKIFWAIVLATLLITLRPNAILIFLPMFFYQKKQMLTVGITLLFWIILPILYFQNTNIWFDYFKAMQYHGLENAGKVPEIAANSFNIPTQLEGVTTTYTNALANIETTINPDIASIQRLLVQLQVPSSSIVLVFLLLSSICLLAFLFFKIRKISFSLSNQILFATIAYCISDYFLPAVRFNYNFVQILIPIFVLAAYKFSISKISFILLFIGMLLQIVKLNFIPECYTVGELLMISGLLLTLWQEKNFKHNIE